MYSNIIYILLLVIIDIINLYNEVEKMDEKKIIENYKKRIQKQNDRIREAYDRISVTLPKGTKDRIQAQGLTINGFVNQLVLEKLDELENNNNECPF